MHFFPIASIRSSHHRSYIPISIIRGFVDINNDDHPSSACEYKFSLERIFRDVNAKSIFVFIHNRVPRPLEVVDTRRGNTNSATNTHRLRIGIAAEGDMSPCSR